MDRILIIGATSSLAWQCARLFAQEGSSFALCARNKEKLAAVAVDLKQNGARSVTELLLDVNELERHQAVIHEAVASMGGLDIALIAHGSACDVGGCENDREFLQREIMLNFNGTASLLMVLADYFERQRRGTIAVISSVAGDRGRRVQYVYASCKAALNVLLQGLRQRLHRANVSVVTIKPGLTDTSLTSHLEQGRRFGLYAKPDRVARGMWKAIRKKKNVVYIPWFWKYIMFLVRSIPESLMKRMRF